MRQALIPLLMLVLLAACAPQKPFETASVATGLFIQSSLRAPRDWDGVARQIAHAYATSREPRARLTVMPPRSHNEATPPAAARGATPTLIAPPKPVMVAVTQEASPFLATLSGLLAVRLEEVGIPVARFTAADVQTLQIETRLIDQHEGSSVIVGARIEQGGRQIFGWSRPFTITADDRLLYLPSVADKPVENKRLTVTGS